MARLIERKRLAQEVLSQVEFMLANADGVEGYRNKYARRNGDVNDTMATAEAKRAESDENADLIFKADVAQLVRLVSALADIDAAYFVKPERFIDQVARDSGTRRVNGILGGGPIACSNCGATDRFITAPRSLDYLNYRCACGTPMSTLSETGASR